MTTELSKDYIEAIITQRNLLLRNLQITLGYHKIALGLHQFLDGRDVNWFGFGTYASKTAGRAIRHETLPKALKSAMIRAAGYNNTRMYLRDVLEKPDDIDQSQADNLLDTVLTQVSLLLSEGNLMIFGELALPFYHMLATFQDEPKPSIRKWLGFLKEHCTIGSVEEGGQNLVRESMTCFYEARFEKDPNKKSERILLGNLLVGLHEQTRLQPVIENALAVPFDTFTKGFVRDGKPESFWQILSNNALGYSRKTVLRTVTRMVMTYALPTRDLRIGKDLVPPTGMVNYPRELYTIESKRLLEILATFDVSKNTLSGSGADNWGNLNDRMNFLSDFFRSYQHYDQLLQAPFTEAQITDIELGKYPTGEL